VVVDEETQQSSLIGLLEQVDIVSALPEGMAALPIEFAVVSYWVCGKTGQNEGNRGELRLKLETPDRQELQSSGGDVPDQYVIDLSDRDRMRRILRFDALPLTVAGRYEFRLTCQVDGAAEPGLAATIPLWVNFTPQPQA
jgi:hypothetical protein